MFYLGVFRYTQTRTQSLYSLLDTLFGAVHAYSSYHRTQNIDVEKKQKNKKPTPQRLNIYSMDYLDSVIFGFCESSFFSDGERAAQRGKQAVLFPAALLTVRKHQEK